MIIQSVTGMNKKFRVRPECPLCKSKDNTILFQKPFHEGVIWDYLDCYYKGRIDSKLLSEGVYDIRKCDICNFIWQYQILSDTIMYDLYERWISPEETLDLEIQKHILHRSLQACEVNLVSFLLRRHKPSRIRVLDFGMGWARWCLFAKAMGFETCGSELSESRLAYARANGIEIQGDLSDASAPFDYISAEQVLEHVPDPVGALKNLVEILAPGGLIRVGVPNGRRFQRAFRRGTWQVGKDAIHPLEHINCFTHRTLILCARHCALKPIPYSRLINAHVWQAIIGCSSLSFASRNLLKQLITTSMIFVKQ